MSDDNNDGNRAPLSSLFTFVAGVALLAFIIGVYQTAVFQQWSLYLILAWGAMLALGLIIWSARVLPPPFNKHLIGNPTLSMVGGVAGGVIAAVALAFALNSSLDQEKSLRSQSELMQQQTDTLKRIEAELIQMRAVLSPKPQPVQAAPADTK